MDDFDIEMGDVETFPATSYDADDILPVDDDILSADDAQVRLSRRHPFPQIERPLTEASILLLGTWRGRRVAECDYPGGRRQYSDPDQGPPTRVGHHVPRRYQVIL